MRFLSHRLLLLSFGQRSPFLLFQILHSSLNSFTMQKDILVYKRQSSSSNTLLPSPGTILSPLLPHYNLLPFSLASPGYTPYRCDPSRLLHLLNSIFRFQQSNLDIPIPPPPPGGTKHVSGFNSHIIYRLSLPPRVSRIG